MSDKAGSFSLLISHRVKIKSHRTSTAPTSALLQRVHSGDIPNREQVTGQTLNLGWIARIMDLTLNPWNVRFQPHPVHQRSGRQRHSQTSVKTKTHTGEIRERSFWFFMRHMLHSDHRKGMRSIPWDLKNISEWRIQSHKCTAVAFIFPDPSHIASPFMGSQKLKRVHSEVYSVSTSVRLTSPTLFIQLCALWSRFTFTLTPRSSSFRSYSIKQMNKQQRDDQCKCSFRRLAYLNCKERLHRTQRSKVILIHSPSVSPQNCSPWNRSCSPLLNI